MSSLFKVLVILFVTGLVAGCKIAVIVVEGGEVWSWPAGYCAEGTICIFEVDDTNFAEEFTVIPKKGWYFHKWNSGEGFLCGDSTDPTCKLSFEGQEGSDAVEQMVASSETFYLMPIFKQFSVTVTVDGKEWLQPANFTGYTYDQVNAVCPFPAGVCSGSLKGSTFDLTGYRWASVDEISALFNSYGVTPPFTAPFQERGDLILYDGFADDFEISTITCYGDCPIDFEWVIGMVRDPAPAGEYPYTPYFQTFFEEWPFDSVFANTKVADPLYWPELTESGGIGIWFWRQAELDTVTVDGR